MTLAVEWRSLYFPGMGCWCQSQEMRAGEHWRYVTSCVFDLLFRHHPMHLAVGCIANLYTFRILSRWIRRLP